MKNEVNDFLGSDRRQFEQNNLLENNTPNEPFTLFNTWLKEAIDQNLPEPYAMVLSTAVQNQPSQRVVYLREMQHNQLVFYTNYLSRKGTEIDENAKASLLFFWAQAERQVRFEGVLKKADAQTSDAYFKSRPRNSQLGAWASEQSQVIDSRQTLEDRLRSFEEKFKDLEVPRPPFWGGYLFKTNYVEFWQGRPSRLHDRICYKQDGDVWKKYRIAP